MADFSMPPGFENIVREFMKNPQLPDMLPKGGYFRPSNDPYFQDAMRTLPPRLRNVPSLPLAGGMPPGLGNTVEAMKALMRSGALLAPSAAGLTTAGLSAPFLGLGGDVDPGVAEFYASRASTPSAPPGEHGMMKTSQRMDLPAPPVPMPPTAAEGVPPSQRYFRTREGIIDADTGDLVPSMPAGAERQQPTPTPVAYRGQGTESVRPSPQREPAKPAAGSTYVVKKGDTLWTIAKELLGDASRWKELQDENTFVTDVKKLKIGTRLQIPGGRTRRPAEPKSNLTPPSLEAKRGEMAALERVASILSEERAGRSGVM